MSAWWECEKCGYEWSAACGDDEVPEICDCGGKVSLICYENAKEDES
jgi:rubredoxin|tara:strand:+ start:3913 stop:4053 length:141 start_codon:yes stop_codon:yes gene_type:complete